jgi:hypothetical protein
MAAGGAAFMFLKQGIEIYQNRRAAFRGAESIRIASHET